MKNKTVLYHFLFWTGIYLLWVVVFRSYAVSLTKTVTVEFCYLIFITADYYTISNFIVPQFLLKRRYTLFAGVTTFVILFSAWLRTLVAIQMNLYFFHPVPIPDFATLYFNSLINIAIWVLLITTGKMLIDKMQSQRQLDLLEKEKTKNELNFLKAQINPHALFNSLNTIYGHIDKSNQVARNTLLQFSELLRYQLYDCLEEKVSLGKEIDYIKSYVAFQQLRKNENMIVQLEIENTEKDLKIAPLLLIVLIENTFKFVSADSERENKIIIRLFTEQAVLHVSVFNTLDAQAQLSGNNSNGIGITNFKRRLELLYPNKYDFECEKEINYYKANLTLDLS